MDRRTDRQTLHDRKDRACIASRGKNYDYNVKPFSSNTGMSRTDRWTDRQTDRQADGRMEIILLLFQSRVSVLTTRNKKVYIQLHSAIVRFLCIC